MDDKGNAEHLAELKERFDRIMGHQSNLKRKIFDERDYFCDLITDAIFACQPDLSKILNLYYGASWFTNRLLAASLTLQLFVIDAQGTILETIDDRIKLLNPGKVVLNSPDILQTIPPKMKFELIFVESMINYFNLIDDRNLILGALFSALTPEGSLWITYTSWPDSPLNLKKAYLNGMGTMKGANYKLNVNQSPGGNLNYDFCRLFRDLKRIGFHRVELMYKGLAVAAIIAWK